jgi:hypothetical protein
MQDPRPAFNAYWLVAAALVSAAVWVGGAYIVRMLVG